MRGVSERNGRLGAKRLLQGRGFAVGPRRSHSCSTELSAPPPRSSRTQTQEEARSVAGAGTRLPFALKKGEGVKVDKVLRHAVDRLYAEPVVQDAEPLIFDLNGG